MERQWKELKKRRKILVSMNGIFFSERDLPKDFFKGFSPKIYRRGYGYWIWKPYIVSKMMSRLNDGDILVYTDAGTQCIYLEESDLRNMRVCSMRSDLLLYFSNLIL